MSRKKVCILGAGLSGLSLALSQESKGNQVSLFEKDLQVGGVLQSMKSEGYLLDYGANTFSIRTKKTEDFLKQHKILEYAVDANQECSKRFIVKKNQVICLPQGPLSFRQKPSGWRPLLLPTGCPSATRVRTALGRPGRR